LSIGISEWDCGGISLDEVRIVREGAVRGAEIIEGLVRDAVGVRSSPETAPVPSPAPQAGHRPGARRQMRQQMRRHRYFAEAAAGPYDCRPHASTDAESSVRALCADHLVHREFLDVRWTLRLDSRRLHAFDDPWSEGVEVSA
jgi:hypothetical protein